MCTKDGWGGQPVVIKCVCLGPLERRLCEKDVQATDLPQPDGHERHWESAHMSGFLRFDLWWWGPLCVQAGWGDQAVVIIVRLGPPERRIREKDI